MADLDLTQEIRSLRATFSDIQQVVDVVKLANEVAILKQQAADPNIWDEPVHAQSVTSKLSHAQAMITKLESVQSRLDDLEVLVEMANSEADVSVQNEAKAELSGLQKLISELEIQTLLNGEYDSRAAVVTIRSGAGGDDAGADLAESLDPLPATAVPAPEPAPKKPAKAAGAGAPGSGAGGQELGPDGRGATPVRPADHPDRPVG